MTNSRSEALQKLALENGPIVIDQYGEGLAWRPLDHGTWTPLAFTEPAAAMPWVPEREAIALLVRKAMQAEFLHGTRWENDGTGRVCGRTNEADHTADAILALIPSHSGETGEVK